MSAIPFREALRFWLKLGFISFGGPAGQIAIMHRELVETRRWISERRFLHALNYCMVLPGPEAQQLATYIGWLMHGVAGGLVAGGLFVLPSLAILVVLSWIYLVYGSLPAVAAILYGVKPAVVAIVLAAAWRIGARTIRNAWLGAIAVAAFVALHFLDAPFPAVVVAAGAAGFIGSRIAPGAFTLAGHGASASGPHAPTVIDDDTPTPPHAQFSRGRLVQVVGTALALWGAGLGILAAAFSWPADFTQMAWFFTKAALVTFGGAYAVLPYVVQGAVQDFGWLTATQMIDGLALGETTPGPLIMVVAYVGFLGGWTKAALGPDSLFLAGVLGAGIATAFTFLPSFLFILAGGPLVERTRDDAVLTAPLTAITAAVVGVIVNLAVYFGEHVFRAPGATATVDWVAVAIALVAFAALVRQKTGIMGAIAVSAVAGLALWIAR